MNNTSSANVSIDVKPGLSLSTLSRPEGIAWCTVFALLSLFITVGNLLTIVLFAANKRVRKKSLYLVINMALADLLLGAFALPLYIYVSINNGYQFSLKIVNSTLARVYGLSYGISLWVSLTSAVSISCERFYAVYWPFKHRTLTARTYHIALFVLWTLSSDSHCPFLFTIIQLFHQSCSFIIRCHCRKYYLRKQHRHLEKVPPRKRHFATEEKGREKRSFDEDFNVFFYS